MPEMQTLRYEFKPRDGHNELERAYPDRPDIKRYEATIRDTAQYDEPIKIGTDLPHHLKGTQINLENIPGKTPIVILMPKEGMADALRDFVRQHCPHLTEEPVA